MWEDTNYCWVVLCKNYWFHMRQNVFFRHRIPLGPTDAVAPLPSVNKPFTVRCDECGKTYTYTRKELRRVEMELPEAFKPHPLFQEEAAEDGAPDESSRSAVRESPREESLQEEVAQGEPAREEPQREGAREKPGEDEQKKAKGA
jgi:hypothetical protein